MKLYFAFILNWKLRKYERRIYHQTQKISSGNNFNRHELAGDSRRFRNVCLVRQIDLRRVEQQFVVDTFSNFRRRIFAFRRLYSDGDFQASLLDFVAVLVSIQSRFERLLYFFYVLVLCADAV